jgi:hypothetical protein
MDRDEVDPKRPELLQRVDELTKTPSKSVIAIDYDGVHQSFPAVGQQFVQRRSFFTRATDSLIDVLVRNRKASPLAELA